MTQRLPRAVLCGGMFLAVLLSAAPRCAAADAGWTFEIRAADAPAELPEHPVDDGPLLNTIARVIIDDLKLGLPTIIRLTSYPNEQAYTNAVWSGLLWQPAWDPGRSLAVAPEHASRAHAQRSLRPMIARAQLPLLSALHTSHGLRADGSYAQAFLAIDWLVERYGEPSLRDYLRGYSRRQPATADDEPAPRNWRLAFPISYADFVMEFRAYLRGEPLPGPVTPSTPP